MALRLRFCVLLFAAFSLAAGASDRPPTSLHLVGDHWTAWNPPATTPPDAKVHIVVPGDTLWALAAQHLGNPYLWPQIWEKNQYVLDAHWIYPGDPIVIGVQVVPAESVGAVTEPVATEEIAASPMAAEEETAAEPVASPSALTRPNEPVPLGSESDIYCSGYIGAVDESFSWRISGSEYDSLTPQLSSVQGWEAARGLYGPGYTVKYELTFGDLVYLDGGRDAGLAPGMLLTAVEPRQKVQHPFTHDVVGRFYAYLGRVRVLTVLEDRALAEIVQGCLGMRVGAALVPFTPEPVPLARPPLPLAINSQPGGALDEAPTIVMSESNIYSMGEDHLVWIDRGDADDVAPGDIYSIFRPSRGNNPPVPLGELAVLSVRERSALAKIIDARFPIYIGDRLERH